MNDKCYKCTRRYEGCHDRCDNYKPKQYGLNASDQEYESYLIEAKWRMKNSRNLFRRGTGIGI